MRKALIFFATSFLLQFCADEHSSVTVQQQVTFSINFLDSDHVPSTNASLLLSVSKTLSDTVFTLRKVALSKISNNYVSEPIVLPSGDYMIVDFLLVSDSNKVLFGTPKQNAPLAGLVSSPLPISFTVSSDHSPVITVDVISTENVSAQQLGYNNAGFGFDLPMVLFATADENGSQIPTEATSYILNSEGDTVQRFALVTGNNAINFVGDPDQAYTIHTIKSGFVRSITPFQYSLTDFPIGFNLEPAFSALAHIDPAIFDNTFTIYISASNAHLTVDWGDNSVPQIIDAPNNLFDISHKFKHAGNFYITFSGDHALISEVHSAYGASQMDEMNVDHLPLLNTVAITATRSPKVIDLSHNLLLKDTDFKNAKSTESILFSPSGLTRSIDITGENKLSSESINSIVGVIYSSATSKSVRDGSFRMSESATLGSAAKAQLAELSSIYGWTVFPPPKK